MIANDSAYGKIEISRNFTFQNVFLASAMGTELGSFKMSPRDRGPSEHFGLLTFVGECLVFKLRIMLSISCFSNDLIQSPAKSNALLLSWRWLGFGAW